MSNFKQEPQNYKKDDPVTPYQRAAQLWDERIGTSIVQAKNWRIASLLSLTINCFLALLLVILFSTNKPLLYVAQIGEKGQVTNVAPLLKQYQPTDAENQYAIAQFIRLTMAQGLDPAVVKKNWQTAYSYVGDKATLLLNQFAEKSLSNQSIGKITKTVNITHLEQITPNSYSAQWQQQAYDRNGKIIETKNYSGIFNIAIDQPKTEEQIMTNPLGIKIIYYTLQEK